MWRPWKLSNFQDPPSPWSIYVQNSSTSMTLEVFQKTSFKRATLPPLLQLITNQLKENIIQGWLLYVMRSFFQEGFCFQYQLINLVWLSFDFFSLSWSLIICFFVTLYSCVCSCPEISRNVYTHFLYSFCNQPVLFARLEKVNKPCNNNRTEYVNKRNQHKNQTKPHYI